MSQYTELVQVKRAVVRLLARREHSQFELRRKLKQYCEPPQMLEEALVYCLEKDYQSESRFAEMIIRTRSNQGYGRRRAEQELKQKGVTQDEIEEAFSAITVDWYAVARECFQRKYQQKYDRLDRKNCDRCTRSMLARGFDFEQIKYAKSAESE